MQNFQTLYLFNQAIDAIPELQARYPSLQAIWYDGKSDILSGITSVSHYAQIIVEEEILDRTKEILGNSFSSYSVQKSRTCAQTNKQPIYALPSNDTHVYLFKNLLNFSPNLRFYVTKEKHERAVDTLSKLQIDHSELKLSSHLFDAKGVLLLGNDWGTVEKYVAHQFQRHGIPVACLQESVIDFGDELRRMEWCDYPLVQGIITLKHLHRDVMFLTGNPRYEHLHITPRPTTERIIINSNFTYGIFEDIRAEWIKDVVNACQTIKAEYVISQHPRDTGDLSAYHVIASGASKVHDALMASTILVTRFSSLIHEALAMGRPVIYYNPHNEKMHYDFEVDNRHLIVAKNQQELIVALQKLSLREMQNVEQDPFYETYAMRHFGSADGMASQRVVTALNLITHANYSRRATKSVHEANIWLRYHLHRLKAIYMGSIPTSVRFT